MSAGRFVGDPTADALANTRLEIEHARDKVRRKIRVSMGAGLLRRADLARLGGVLVELAGLREVERHVASETAGDGADEGPT